MTLPEKATDLLDRLIDAGIEFIVVGGGAAVMLGAPLATKDIDIVHARTRENVERLLGVLLDLHAYDHADLARRRLPPSASALLGRYRSSSRRSKNESAARGKTSPRRRHPPRKPPTSDRWLRG